MRVVLNVGVNRPDFADAEYALSEDFKKAISATGVVRYNNPADMAYGNEICDLFRRKGICSTLQCLIGNVDNPKGLVVFNKIHAPSMWAEYEVDSARLFAASLALIDLNEL